MDWSDTPSDGAGDDKDSPTPDAKESEKKPDPPSPGNGRGVEPGPDSGAGPDSEEKRRKAAEQEVKDKAGQQEAMHTKSEQAEQEKLKALADHWKKNHAPPALKQDFKPVGSIDSPIGTSPKDMPKTFGKGLELNSTTDKLFANQTQPRSTEGNPKPTIEPKTGETLQKPQPAGTAFGIVDTAKQEWHQRVAEKSLVPTAPPPTSWVEKVQKNPKTEGDCADQRERYLSTEAAQDRVDKVATQKKIPEAMPESNVPKKSTANPTTEVSKKPDLGKHTSKINKEREPKPPTKPPEGSGGPKRKK